MRAWVLDERGLIREHINVFVNGNHGREATPVGPDDRVHVLPAITGGRNVTELLGRNEEGLVRAGGRAGTPFEVDARAFAGQSVEYAMRDPRSGRYLASVTSWFYGPKIWVTDDPAGEWEQAQGANCRRAATRQWSGSG